MSGNAVPFGGGLAVTGLALPFGWYFVIAVVVVVLGFLLVRLAMRRKAKHTPRHA